MIERARALADELVRLRRDIHAHPELSFQEHRTAALVADTLTEIGGFAIRTGVAKTGVVAELGSDGARRSLSAPIWMHFLFWRKPAGHMVHPIRG